MADRLLGNRGLSTKIIGGIAVMAVVALAVGVLGINRMSAMNASTQDLYRMGLLQLTRVQSTQVAMLATSRDVLNHALSNSDAAMAKYEQAIRNDDARFTTALDSYAKDSVVPELAAELRTAWATYQKDRPLILAASRRNDLKEVERVRDQVTAPEIDKSLRVVDQIVQRETADAQRRVASTTDLYHSARTVTIAALSIGILLAMTFGLMMTRTIRASVKKVSSVVASMAGGDLTRRAEVRTTDEIGQMAAGLDHTITQLAGTVGAVIDSAKQLDGAANQISGASQSLAQTATEQASGVDETTANIEQMGAGISRNSENATLTEGIAARAAADAADGGTAVRQTADAMRQIAKKINFVDDLAFQTTMLALNATIEAARAGEHGQGFAVVAAEVGKLAERSKAAAQEISELAAESVNTAEWAGTLLQQIVPSIAETSTLVHQIAAASNEQSTGVRQIDTVMGQVSKTTQQNAAASEELAATAEQMSAQTAQLQEVMKFFTTTTTTQTMPDAGRGRQRALSPFDAPGRHSLDASR